MVLESRVQVEGRHQPGCGVQAPRVGRVPARQRPRWWARGPLHTGQSSLSAKPRFRRCSKKPSFRAQVRTTRQPIPRRETAASKGAPRPAL